MANERRVFVPNKGPFDYSLVKDFGEPVFITDGPVDRFAVTNLMRSVEQAMEDSNPDDFVLISGLPLLNALVSSFFVSLHGRLNLLLYTKGRYVERTLEFEDRDD